MHAVGIGGQVGQQAIFGGRQFHGSPSTVTWCWAKSISMGPASKLLAGHDFFGPLAAAKHGLHAHQQFVDSKGLGQIVVGADLKAVDQVHLGAAGSEHDDGYRRELADAAAHSIAIHLGQHQVQR